jgi:thymidylate synthase
MMNELGYLNLLSDVLKNGVVRDDRTGVGTRSLFGRQLRFDLRNEVMPVLTTKRVFWRGVVEELLWFLRGDTDATILKERGVHIWDGNTSREFLDKSGLFHYPEGEAGPVYGFQWRRFGAVHRLVGDAAHPQPGVDQIEELLRNLRNDPWSRRHVLSAWNPVDLPHMALPPCHILYQFYVNRDRTLSCHLVMRSSDVFLGLPFNIASASLLTAILAAKAGLAGSCELVVSTGDTHLYSNHLEAARMQLDREYRQMPTLVWDRKAVASKDWQDMTADDFRLNGYYPHATIPATMAV